MKRQGILNSDIQSVVLYGTYGHNLYRRLWTADPG